MLSKEELDRRFSHYPLPERDIRRLERVRDAARSFARQIDGLVPDSREKSVAMTAIEDAMMWANAGIARKDR